MFSESWSGIKNISFVWTIASNNYAVEDISYVVAIISYQNCSLDIYQDSFECGWTLSNSLYVWEPDFIALRSSIIVCDKQLWGRSGLHAYYIYHGREGATHSAACWWGKQCKATRLRRSITCKDCECCTNCALVITPWVKFHLPTQYLRSTQEGRFTTGVVVLYRWRLTLNMASNTIPCTTHQWWDGHCQAHQQTILPTVAYSDSNGLSMQGGKRVLYQDISSSCMIITWSSHLGAYVCPTLTLLHTTSIVLILSKQVMFTHNSPQGCHGSSFVLFVSIIIVYR